MAIGVSAAVVGSFVLSRLVGTFEVRRALGSVPTTLIPDDRAARSSLARAEDFYAMGRWGNARTAYEKALESDPECVWCSWMITETSRWYVEPPDRADLDAVQARIEDFPASTRVERPNSLDLHDQLIGANDAANEGDFSLALALSDTLSFYEPSTYITSGREQTVHHDEFFRALLHMLRSNWHLARGDSLPAYQLARIVRRVLLDSAGLPLLAVEILQAVSAGLEYHGGGDAWPRPFQTLDQSMPADLPGHVIAAVRVRFSCLSSTARALLEIASIIRPPVSEKDFTVIGGFDERDVVVALDELEWTRWLTSDSGAIRLSRGSFVRSSPGIW
ncbi:MAG: hypothetical protein ACE5HT_14600 [Gemmatimonadales bacterium]